QTVIGLTVFVIFAATGMDPLVQLFFYGWASGGLGVLMLITITAAGVLRLLVQNTIMERRLRDRIAPPAVIVVPALVLAAAIVNFKGLLGTPPGSALPWLVPTLYVVIGLAGVLWGLVLSRSRPQVYSRIGGGTGCAETRVPRAAANGAS